MGLIVALDDGTSGRRIVHIDCESETVPKLVHTPHFVDATVESGESGSSRLIVVCKDDGIERYGEVVVRAEGVEEEARLPVTIVSTLKASNNGGHR